jgi:hypothetical protein
MREDQRFSLPAQPILLSSSCLSVEILDGSAGRRQLLLQELDEHNTSTVDMCPINNKFRIGTRSLQRLQKHQNVVLGLVNHFSSIDIHLFAEHNSFGLIFMHPFLNSASGIANKFLIRFTYPREERCVCHNLIHAFHVDPNPSRIS